MLVLALFLNDNLQKKNINKHRKTKTSEAFWQKINVYLFCSPNYPKLLGSLNFIVYI